MLIGDCELDPEDIINAIPELIERLRATGNVEIDSLHIDGYDHISPPLALGSNIPAGEKWGLEVLSWSKKRC
jgi:hypothetical protein